MKSAQHAEMVEQPDLLESLPCFAAGTLIRTDVGDRLVETLRPGDAILTRDNGFQSLRWIGSFHLSSEDLDAHPHFHPIELAPSALGAHQPSLPLLVSPQHRVLLHGFGSDLLCGETDVVVAASHLLDWDCISRAGCEAVTYVHLLFDRSEIVLSNGAWTQCVQPQGLSLSDLEDAPCEDDERALSASDVVTEAAALAASKKANSENKHTASELT